MKFRRRRKPSVDEALEMIERTARNMQRSLRRPQPVPRVGVDAGLELIRLAAREARGLPGELDRAA